VAFLDSTMVRFWDIGRIPLEQIAARLRDSWPGRLLSREDLRAEGLDFSHTRFGEQVYLLNPGWILRPSFMEVPLPGNRGLVRGMHGYHPLEAASDALFLYHGDQAPVHDPRKLTDVAAAITALATN
jgi:hypothetical protein